MIKYKLYGDLILTEQEARLVPDQEELKDIDIETATKYKLIDSTYPTEYTKDDLASKAIEIANILEDKLKRELLGSRADDKQVERYKLKYSAALSNRYPDSKAKVIVDKYENYSRRLKNYILDIEDLREEITDMDIVEGLFLCYLIRRDIEYLKVESLLKELKDKTSYIEKRVSLLLR